MRVVGVDLGSKRIGIAVSDLSGIIATPRTVIARSGDIATDHARITALVEEEEAGRVVIGLPLNMDGTPGPAAKAAVAEARALATVVGVPVDTYDERRTTVTAQAVLRGRGVRARDQRGEVDKVAAAVMLQSWLDSRAARAVR